MPLRKKLLNACLALALPLWFAGAAHADALIDRAAALLQQGNARAAYELLAPEESARAGNVAYDFLLGLAALESGRNTSAVFAFERVLAVEPNHVRARAEIARAYLALGETNTARQELETVKQQGVPPEVAATIDRLLAAIERGEDTGRTALRGYLEATLGYDTNVNGATAGRDVAVPLFGGAIFTLDANSTRQSDLYATVGGGANLRHPLAKDIALVASVNGMKRMNQDHDRFDNGSADASVGLTMTEGKNTLSMALQYGQFQVDNRRHRNTRGFTLQMQHNFDARNQGSLFVQHASLRYQGGNKPRDADRTVFGLNYAHALPGFKTVYYGTLYAGDEDTVNAGFPHLGHSLYGARIGAQHEFRPDARVFANLGYENRSYNGADPFFLRTREDDHWSLGIGAVWMPAKNWRVTPQYQHTDNRSNIQLNRYRRDVVSVTVRRDF